MSSDSVRPSSLSLRTSRLNDGVSRPSSAARSGARTSGERSMIASVCLVHGPMDDAASSRSRRPRISASSASVGGAAARDPRVLAPPAQAHAEHRPVRPGRQPAPQGVEGRGAGPAGIVLGDRGFVDGLDGRDLDQPDGGAHPGTDDDTRPVPAAEAEIDGSRLDPGELDRPDHHADQVRPRASMRRAAVRLRPAALSRPLRAVAPHVGLSHLLYRVRRPRRPCDGHPRPAAAPRTGGDDQDEWTGTALRSRCPPQPAAARPRSGRTTPARRPPGTPGRSRRRCRGSLVEGHVELAYAQTEQGTDGRLQRQSPGPSAPGPLARA